MLSPKNNYAAIKRSFDWLDHDKDQCISIQDIEVSFSIQYPEAKALFDSLNSTGSQFINFEDFSKGFLNFPSILEQFGEELPDTSTVSPKKTISIESLQNNVEEDFIERFSVILENFENYSTDTITGLTRELVKYSRNLKKQLNDSIEKCNSQAIESKIQTKALLNEKIRIEENYNGLLVEQQVFDRNFKELEEKYFSLECETRENRLKNAELVNENAKLQKIIEKLNSELVAKDKNIVELRKRVSTKSSLLTPNSKIKRTCPRSKSEQPGKTSQAVKSYEFPAQQEFLNPKDQIIKNLKSQLSQKTFECEKLDKKLEKVVFEKVELLEKVKFLSLTNPDTEEDEDSRSLGKNCLRDELFIADPAFNIGSRFSGHSEKLHKEVSMQVNYKKDLKLQRNKRRYFCLSLFS